jgi:hypothetical protein
MLANSQAEARRSALREDAEENRMMMQYRSFYQQQERELEREAIQKTIKSEVRQRAATAWQLRHLLKDAGPGIFLGTGAPFLAHHL